MEAQESCRCRPGGFQQCDEEEKRIFWNQEVHDDGGGGEGMKWGGCGGVEEVDGEESGGEAREVGGYSGDIQGKAQSEKCDKESEGIEGEESGWFKHG